MLGHILGQLQPDFHATIMAGIRVELYFHPAAPRIATDGAAVRQLKGRYSLITDVAGDLGWWACFPQEDVERWPPQTGIQCAAQPRDVGTDSPNST